MGEGRTLASRTKKTSSGKTQTVKKKSTRRKKVSAGKETSARNKPTEKGPSDVSAGNASDPITERKRADAEIRNLAKFPSENPNPVLRIARDGKLLYRNEATDRLLAELGVSERDIALILRVDFQHLVEKALSSGTPIRDVEVMVKDRWLNYSLAPVVEAGYVNLYATDVTERKQAERHREVAAQVLERLNRPAQGNTVISEILKMLKAFTGVDAVGMRLRKDDDYPYFVTRGFDAKFVREESPLCVKDALGEIRRDDGGKPLLACMCGNVLTGRIDPGLPFFTEGGSFWTNSTTDLLCSTSPDDRAGHTRNHCNSAGYESVALVPLRSGNEIIGLLQLNDRQTGRFTPRSIAFLEEVGSSIGIAIARNLAEDALRDANDLLEERVAERSSQLSHTVDVLRDEIAQRREAEARLRNYQARLKSMASELTLVEERQRRHIAADLHDSVGQTLAACDLKLGGLRKKFGESKDLGLDEVRGLLHECSESVRAMMFELSPPVLHELGLAQAIEWLGSRMKEEHGLKLKVDNRARPKMLNEDTRTLVFRCVQELTRNVAKHAGTLEVVVCLTCDGDEFHVAVIDRGRGFDGAAFRDEQLAGDGFGLFSIRERLNYVGGSMHVASEPGKGTRVNLTVPLRPIKEE